MTGDMIKKLKNCFFKKCQFLHFLLKLKVKNCFLKKQPFSILIISLVIFNLQKHTIHQNKAKDIGFRPNFLTFIATINIHWNRKLWSCLVFYSDFMSFFQSFSQTEKLKTWESKASVSVIHRYFIWAIVYMIWQRID